MNKWLENIKLKIISKMETNRKQYEEADASYKETGYDRYYNKMVKLDEEYEELKKFLNVNKEDDTYKAKYIRENKELLNVIKNVKSKVFYLSKELPTCAELINLLDILRDY